MSTPYCEINERTQLQYLKQLAARTGHSIGLTLIHLAAWLDALRRSNAGDHEAMTRCIRPRARVTARLSAGSPPPIPKTGQSGSFARPLNSSQTGSRNS